MRNLWRRYRLLFVRSLFQRRQTPAPHRRPVLFCLAYLLQFPFVLLFHGACLLFDRLAFFGYRRFPLKEPVFIIGNPRSGTTISHRVLACDEERFFYFKSWEIMFPAISQKLVLSGLAKVDAIIGRPFERCVRLFEKRMFDEFSRYHQLGLYLPEEDDKVLAHILAAIDLSYFFPYGDFQRWGQMDVTVPRDEQDEAMNFYRHCVLRQGWFHGGQRTLLSKNPFFTGKVNAILRHFPDGKLIYMIRNPLDVIPSTISMLRAIIALSFNKETDVDLDETVYDLLKFYYFYPLEQLAQLPDDRYLIVNYSDMVRDPETTMKGIYQHFDWQISPQFSARLDAEVAAMREHRSRHKYSLEQSVVTRERIVADLRPIFDRFGFDTREPGAPVPEPVLAATSAQPQVNQVP